MPKGLCWFGYLVHSLGADVNTLQAHGDDFECVVAADAAPRWVLSSVSPPSVLSSKASTSLQCCTSSLGGGSRKSSANLN